MAFTLQADLTTQEAQQYRPGLRVELKQRPGVVDVIAEYDPMMVPPIWLVGDPQPRYPEELILLSEPLTEWFKSAITFQPEYPSCHLKNRPKQKVLV
ncbi:hypothetical protein [Floridanema evergladense]|uniref:Uncharacterized protein n=1 Tax=Floridaenema evergladense BLCC-F167 TaxID=3153639 RepID=A0ABV4WIP1_9CYAN